jgi:TRAP transporter TAXI family solute receptor
MKTKITLSFLSAVIVSVLSVHAQLPILSGPSQGSYSRFIGDIEKVLTADSTKMVINNETDGSAFNLEKLADRNTPFKLALVQSDYLFHMKGLDMLNNTEKTKNIKVVLPLADEEIHLITISDSELNKLQDLEGKMVGIGTQYQGTYFTSGLIKNRSKVIWNSRNIGYEDALSELNTNKIDAFFVVGSAPMEKLDIDPRAFAKSLKLIPLIDFDDWAKYYQNDTIHASDYKWLENDIPTFKVKTLLVVNDTKLTEKDRKDIALIIEGIKANMDKLKANGHHKWKDVDLLDWDSNDWPFLE